MNVLLINNKFIEGGAEKVFRDTIKILKTNKKDILIYTATCDDIPNELIPFVEAHIKLYDSKKNPIDYIFNFRNYKKLLTFLEQHNIDIIHLHNFYGSISPSILMAIKKYKQKKKCKVIQTVHDYSIVCPNSSLMIYHKNAICEKCVGNGFKFHILLKRCYHGNLFVSGLKFLRWLVAHKALDHKNIVDLFITPSNFLRGILLREGIDDKKLIVVPNPVSIPPIAPEASKDKTILFVGRLSYEKGIDLLIRTFRNLKAKGYINDDYKLLIVGDGPLRKELENSNSKDDIIFLGYLTPLDCYKIMRRSELLVLPSIWYENHPLVVLEALSNGTAVVLTNHGGMKELAEKFPKMIFPSDYNESREKVIANLESSIITTLGRLKSEKGLEDYFTILLEWSEQNYFEKIMMCYNDFNEF